MSINTGDALELAPPALQCGLCFPPGDTPKYVFACFTGIVRGPLADPGDPPPPNGIHTIPVVAPCDWELDPAPICSRWIIAAGFSWLELYEVKPEFFFIDWIGVNCVTWFENNQLNPLVDKYYGGFGSIWHLGSAGDGQLLDVCEKAGVEPADQTWANPRPKSNDQTVITISRRSDSTNIHVLWDHS